MTELLSERNNFISEFSLKGKSFQTDAEIEADLKKHHDEWINSEKYAYKYKYFHKLLARLDNSKSHYLHLLVSQKILHFDFIFFNIRAEDFSLCFALLEPSFFQQFNFWSLQIILLI